MDPTSPAYLASSPKKLSPQMERVSNDLHMERRQNQQRRLNVSAPQPVPVAGASERRRALTGADSPRAPHRQLDEIDRLDMDEDELSPLAPLDDMLLSQSDEADTVLPAQTSGPSSAHGRGTVSRERRRAISSEDSPRAPVKAMPHPEHTTEMTNLSNSPLPPVADMLDTPRTSARFIARARPTMINTNTESGPVNELREGDFDNLDDLRLSSDGELHPADHATSGFRRKALSGMDSPRAPKQPGSNDVPGERIEAVTPNTPLPPMDEMLVTPRSFGQAQSSQIQHAAAPKPATAAPAASVQPTQASVGRPTRRQALSGADSPRAPAMRMPEHALDGWEPTDPNSPLQPLSEMLASPKPTQGQCSTPPAAVDKQGSTSSEESGLKRIDSLPQLAGAEFRRPSDPMGSADASNTHDIAFITQRLADAEDANMQWAEYCMQIQQQNSALLAQLSMLQQQNTTLQKQLFGQQNHGLPVTRDSVDSNPYDVNEYQAALSVEISSPMSPCSQQYHELSQNLPRRNALSGRASPRAPPMLLTPTSSSISGSGQQYENSFHTGNSRLSTASPTTSPPLPTPIKSRLSMSPSSDSEPEPQVTQQTNGLANSTPPRSSPSAPMVSSSPLLQRLLNTSAAHTSKVAGANEEVSSQPDPNLNKILDALEDFASSSGNSEGILAQLQDRLTKR